MVNIKSYKDGDRFILMVENCSGELAVKVNHFLTDIMGLDAEPQKVPALIPQIVPQEKALDEPSLQPAYPGAFKEPPDVKEISAYVLTEGKYSGETVQQAIMKYGLNAAIDISCHAKAIDQTLQKQIIEKCKQIIYADVENRNAETDTMEEITTFFNQYNPLIESGVKRILEMSGYETLDDFFTFAEETIQRDAYYSIVNGLLARVT